MKCKLIHGRRVCKGNNPFKMKLPWILFGIGVLFDILCIINAFTCNSYMCGLTALGVAIVPIGIFKMLGVTVFLLTGNLIVELIFYGSIQLAMLFLLGWGIHSLVRALRK